MVTGANGFVAGSVLAQAGDEWDVHPISRGQPPERWGGQHWHISDSLERSQLGRSFCEAQPDAVIHTAALADIDFCQAHPDLARAVNVGLTRNLTELCAEAGTRLVFCSTDTLFDGEHAPYDEAALPGPINLYAETKVEGEQIVRRLGAQAVIARLSLVIGLPVLGAGNSFLARMIGSLKQGQTVGMTEREVRTPVDVITVGRALLELAAGKQQGIFHLAGHSRVSRLEMAQAVAARFGLPQQLVVAQPRQGGSMGGRAPRPRDVSLDNRRACAELKTPMRSLDEGLSLIIQNQV